MPFDKIKGWFADRFGLDAAHDAVLDRQVPKTPWYYGDGMTLSVLFGVQVATGGVLALSYSASTDAAHESILYITHVQPLGWFVRGLHYWSAAATVVMLFWHVLRQVLVAGYKAPREGTWIIGVGLFFLVQIMALTGYMLRGDEKALYAIRVVLNLAYAVPLVGESLVLALQGGPSFGPQTLARVFAIHVVLVPALLGLGILHHIYLVVIRGVTSPIERQRPIHSQEQHDELYTGAAESETEGERFWPYSVAEGMGFATAVFGGVVVLTLLFGPGEVDPAWNLHRDAFPAEEWWLGWFSTMSAMLPPALAPIVYLLLPIGVFALLIALPLLDRGPGRGMRRRPLAVVVVVGTAAALLYATDLRRRSPWTAWPVDEPPAVPAGVVLQPDLEAGRQLFSDYGCNTCHPVAGSGPRRFGPDLARIEPPLSYEALRAVVLEPPSDWQMPGYRGRIEEDRLDLLVRYVLAAQTFPRDRR